MKKKLVVIAIICLLAICYRFTNAGITDWFNSAIDSGKYVINYLIDKADSAYINTQISDKTQYYAFKDQAKKILEEINTHLDVFEKTDDAAELAQAEKLFNELWQKHENLLKQAQKELSTKDFEVLKKDIEGRMQIVRNFFRDFNIKDTIINLFNIYGAQKFRDAVNFDNPYSKITSYVRQRVGLSKNEELFLAQRLPRSIDAQSRFLNETIDEKEALRIGFVGTGGGYRALFLTSGYTQALEKMGLLDAVLWYSTLSGSTWYLAMFMLGGGTASGTTNLILKKIQEKAFDLTRIKSFVSAQQVERLVKDIFWPKFVFGQIISTVDLYGAILSQILLNNFGDARLSGMWNIAKTGKTPFPIFTSVSMHKESSTNAATSGGKEYKYNWYEFNPLEVVNLENRLAVDVFSFGRQFEGGNSVDFAPEQTLGFLLGIFSSAYAVNLLDLERIVLDGIDKTLKDKDLVDQIKDKVKYEITKFIIQSLSSNPMILKARISPAQVNNPWNSLPASFKLDSWLRNRKTLTFVDARVATNIPIAPLLQPERRLDVIIIGDSSGNILEGEGEMPNMLADAKERGFNYVHYTEFEDSKNPTMRVYKDTSASQGPVIICINFTKDEAFMNLAIAKKPELQRLVDSYNLRTFNLAQCLEKGYCGTFNFNFDYSEADFKQLAGIAEFNMLANADKIDEIMRTILEEKRKRLGIKEFEKPLEGNPADDVIFGPH